MTEVGCGLAGHNKLDLRAALDRTITWSGKPKNIVNLDQVYLSTSAMYVVRVETCELPSGRKDRMVTAAI